MIGCRLDWPVRTISFSHDGRMLASASEDLLIDIADVETGRKHLLTPRSVSFNFELVPSWQAGKGVLNLSRYGFELVLIFLNGID